MTISRRWFMAGMALTGAALPAAFYAHRELTREEFPITPGEATVDLADTAGQQLADNLRVMVETYWRDGEVLAMRTCRPRNWPISLDIRIYEAEQCAAPWIGNSLGDPWLDDGIRVDQNTNEVEYFFYDHHPGDTSFTPTLNGK